MRSRQNYICLPSADIVEHYCGALVFSASFHSMMPKCRCPQFSSYSLDILECIQMTLIDYFKLKISVLLTRTNQATWVDRSVGVQPIYLSLKQLL